MIEPTAVIRRGSIEELVAHRDRALEAYRQAEEAARAASDAAGRAAPFEKSYMAPKAWVGCRTSGRGPDAASEFRKEVDRAAWRYVVERMGMERLMSARQREEFRRELEHDPPPFTVENATATAARMAERAQATFEESVVDVFKMMPARYRSHDGFKIGGRIVMEFAVSVWGAHVSWRIGSYRSRRDDLDDLDRIMHLLDGKPQEGRVSDLASKAMQEGESACESPYFRLRWFRNGNLHVYPLRDDLVERCNRIIAKHFGAALGKAPN